MTRHRTPRQQADIVFGLLLLPVLWPATVVYYVLDTDLALPVMRHFIERGYWIRDVLAWAAVIAYLAIVFNWDVIRAIWA